MRSLFHPFHLMFFTAFLLISCRVFSVHEPVPVSARSVAAEDRVLPGLQKEFQARGWKWGASIFIRVFKQSASLELWVEQENKTFERFKTYEICTFSGKLGPKTREGDFQAPEGFYYVGRGNMNPWSRYHLAFNLGYPNAYDRSHGYTGSALMVHGNCVSIGCYAMTDESIEEIYILAQSALNHGQPFFRVHVFPFELTEPVLSQWSDHRWYTFWRGLKVGYDYFEETKIPPNIIVKNRKYIIAEE